MKKKTFFSNIVTIILLILTLIIGAIIIKIRNQPTASGLQPSASASELITEHTFSFITAEFFKLQTYKMAFGELTFQSSGTNLLYSEDLNTPVILTARKSSWPLLNDATMINFSSQPLPESIRLTSCAYYVKISNFYYQFVDSMEFLKTDAPPEEGWIEIPPNEDGSYSLPLNQTISHGGYSYTAIKYVCENSVSYYGFITIGPGHE